MSTAKTIKQLLIFYFVLTFIPIVVNKMYVNVTM